MPAVQLIPFNPRFQITMAPRVYLDTNFLLHARDKGASKYIPASTCLAELLRQGVEMNVSALMFDEAWCVYMRKSYEVANGGRRLDPPTYKADPKIWQQHWPAIDKLTTEILGAHGFKEVACSVGAIRLAQELMNLNPLTPRDAFHAAIAIAEAIPWLVTADRDFDKLQLPPGRQLAILKI